MGLICSDVLFQICLHANCVFELVSNDSVMRKAVFPGDTSEADYLSSCPQLRLKGQMMPFPSMDTIAFLCSPV